MRGARGRPRPDRRPIGPRPRLARCRSTSARCQALRIQAPLPPPVPTPIPTPTSAPSDTGRSPRARVRAADASPRPRPRAPGRSTGLLSRRARGPRNRQSGPPAMRRNRDRRGSRAIAARDRGPARSVRVATPGSDGGYSSAVCAVLRPYDTRVPARKRVGCPISTANLRARRNGGSERPGSAGRSTSGRQAARSRAGRARARWRARGGARRPCAGRDGGRPRPSSSRSDHTFLA